MPPGSLALTHHAQTPHTVFNTPKACLQSLFAALEPPGPHIFTWQPRRGAEQPAISAHPPRTAAGIGRCGRKSSKAAHLKG